MQDFPASLAKGSQCFQADLRIVGEEPIATVIEYGFLQDVVQFLYGLGHDECPAAHVIELTDIVGAQACIGAIYEPAVPGHLDDFFFERDRRQLFVRISRMYAHGDGDAPGTP